MGLSQLLITVFGLTSIAFAMGNNAELRMWAPLIGLAGQPFWGWFAWKTKAWGLGVLVVAYSAVYAWAVWVQWGLSA